MWLADLRTTSTVVAPLLEPYADTGFSQGAQAPLGVVCGKPRGNWAWFSEPPNKELSPREAPCPIHRPQTEMFRSRSSAKSGSAAALVA
jgi:hypothetical protein